MIINPNNLNSGFDFPALHDEFGCSNYSKKFAFNANNNQKQKKFTSVPSKLELFIRIFKNETIRGSYKGFEQDLEI